MGNKRFTFQYQVKGQDTWHPRADIWKTRTGAVKAADKWRSFMAEEGCMIYTQVCSIENGQLVPEEE